MGIGDSGRSFRFRLIGASGGAALLAAAMFVLAPAAGWSQETPPAEPAATPAPEEEGTNIGFKEEVTVTARKQGAETVQEVPTSVAAPSEEQLRNRGAQTIEDVAVNVPGFTVQNLGPGQSQVAMRGVSAGQVVRDQPGVKEQVGVYLDESPISMSLFTPDLDLFDLNRVEVLRGPQGTLFGAGSLSGTVRYITNQPELGRTSSVVELTGESISGGGTGGSGKVAFNQPLGDTAAMRLTAYYTTYGGYMDAVQPSLRVNQDVNDGERWGARLAFRFAPNDNVTVTPRLLYQKVDLNGWNRIDAYNILGNPFTTTRPRVNLGDRQFTQIEEPFTDEFMLADLTFDYRFGDDLTLTSVSSYIDRDVDVIRDATALTASITGGSIGLPPAAYTIDAPLDDVTTAKVWAQELRLAKASDRLSWVAGLFYTQIDRDYGQHLFVRGFEAVSGIPTQLTFNQKDELFFSRLSYDFKQKAAFGEATWNVNERLELTGGLRYYQFDESREQIFDALFGADGNGNFQSQPGETDADGFAPRAIASFKVNDNSRLNFQVAKGFRLGGINDPLNVTLCTPEDLSTFGGHDQWEDETAWNYEIGTKNTIMGGRGIFNLSVFHMDIDDLQATVTAGSCSSRVIFNVPKARSQGIELEFNAAPTSKFDFALSASYADSELRSTLRSGGQVLAGIEEGNRLPTVPKLQYTAALTFQQPVGTAWLGFATAVYQHVGSRFTQVGDQAQGFGTVDLLSFAPNNIGGPYTQNTFTFDPELPEYDLLNFRVGVLKEKLEIAAFVNNVTDERALLALDQERGTRARVSYLTNQPRTFGITTRFHFR